MGDNLELVKNALLVAAGVWRDTVYDDRAASSTGVWPEERALANLVETMRALEGDRR